MKDKTRLFVGFGIASAFWNLAADGIPLGCRLATVAGGVIFSFVVFCLCGDSSWVRKRSIWFGLEIGFASFAVYLLYEFSQKGR
jgi:hypothetical protein